MANNTVDGVLLVFNNTFLSNLIEENYEISKIRFKYVSNSRSSMYRTFATYQDFVVHYSALLNDPGFACLSGPLPILESMTLINNKLNFENSYVARNITTSVNVQKNFKYDSYRKTFNESQAKLYQTYLTKRFINYLKDASTLTNLRQQQYIDGCYIDPNYFKDDSLQMLTI